ncbi:30S ribosomal protein S3 [bacterium]|nr:30S ribosomal protein S3 [bacterium]
MGQKANPIGFRVGITRDWECKWYSKRDYAKYLHEDLKIKKMVKELLENAAVSKVRVERQRDSDVRVFIETAFPSRVIGRKGTEVAKLRNTLAKELGKSVHIEVVSIENADTEAMLVAANLASQLCRRVSFRRAMKRAIGASMRAGVQGIKVACSGRLGGAEMARREWYLDGRLPLHTLRADIDYGYVLAKTTYGCVGVKVWIFKGETLTRAKKRGISHVNASKA